MFEAAIPFRRFASFGRDSNGVYWIRTRVRDSTDKRQEPYVSPMTIDDNKLKALLKQALLELLEEKNEILFDTLTEVVEEMGLVKAIKEG